MSGEAKSDSYQFKPPQVEYRIVRPINDFVRFEDSELQQSIPSRFEKQARKYPDRLAIKTKTQQFTYDELNKAANRAAWTILERRGEKHLGKRCF